MEKWVKWNIRVEHEVIFLRLSLLWGSSEDVLYLDNYAILLGSLSTRVFETRTATGSELFSLLTCPNTTTFTLLSIFSPLEMNSIKIWETIRSKNANCSLPVAVRVSKTRVLKLPNMLFWVLMYLCFFTRYSLWHLPLKLFISSIKLLLLYKVYGIRFRSKIICSS